MSKSDAYYAAQARLKAAERHVADEIRYGRPGWKIKEAEKQLGEAQRIFKQAERDG